MRCIELNGVCVSVLPETGGVGSEGCSTDNCLNTAYLSEEEEDEDPDTGVSMAGTLHEADKTYSNQSKQIKVLYKLRRVYKSKHLVLRYLFLFFDGAPKCKLNEQSLRHNPNLHTLPAIKFARLVFSVFHFKTR